MIALVPKWAHHYNEFWKAIRLRNLWFIKLRYLFILALFLFLTIGEYFLKFNLSSTQTTAVVSMMVTIFFYNIFIYKIRDHIGNTPGKFNCLHLSLIQSLLDLTMLMLLVYFTGIIDSPFFMFFIFQMIIGSLILPGYVVYFIAVAVIAVFSVMIFMQHLSLLPSHIIIGLYPGGITHPLSYDFFFIMLFSMVLLFSVYIANKIARQIYQQEQNLRESLIQLNKAEIAKQHYIIGVVHELKTPIAAVKSILDLVLHDFVGPVGTEVKEKLTRAGIRTDEGINLINNILRLSKLKLLDITSTEEINLDQLIQELITKKTELAFSKGISFSFCDNRKEERCINGDKILLELALSNIVANSIKYIGFDGNIEIELNDTDTEHIEISICDDGIGIPGKDIDRIFDQFYRASNVKKERYEGSGLGLSVVKEIIERHNGIIKVSSPSKLSKEGKPGTVFIVQLPYTGNQSEITSNIIPDDL